MGRKRSKLRISSTSSTYKHIYMRGYNAGKKAGNVKYVYRNVAPITKNSNGVTINTLLSPPTGF